MVAPDTGPPGRPRLHRHRRRRRPVGEPPALPRDLHGATPIIWIGVAILLTLGFIWGMNSGLAGEFQRAVDDAIADAVAELGPSGAVIRALEDSTGWWPALIWMRWLIALALVVTKRWRHLAVFIASVIAVDVLTRVFPTAGVVETGVESHASPAAAGLAVTMLGVVYGLVPAGRARRLAQLIAGAVWLGVGWVLLITGEDTFGEIMIGGAIGFAMPFLAYRLFVPETVFPVDYHRGRTAHLDVGGRRGDAIRTALAEQLGIEAIAVEPFGLEGSGGSTPLRILTGDGGRLFAKLYATTHLRADRWYKLGRAVSYGALEDERSFNSVRRMVEYEDHMLRYLRDSGIEVAEPYGFVELTPEREYLIVTGFIEDGVELTVATVDDDVIRGGIAVVRALWDAGLAHRDIKPANLLVRSNGRVTPIDVFFCQVRPSPWRQSVDLANMLLCLALRSDVRRVYDLTMDRFTETEVAEAFAATRGVAIPGQLRALVHDDPRDLIGAFRAMAPPRDPVQIQRWTIRRLAMLTALLTFGAAILALSMLNLKWAGFLP